MAFLSSYLRDKDGIFFNFVDNPSKYLTCQQIDEKIQSFHVNDLELAYSIFVICENSNGIFRKHSIIIDQLYINYISKDPYII